MKITRRINSALESGLGIHIKRVPISTEVNDTSLPAIIGVVDGFERNKVTGWVSTPKSTTPIRITLNINGLPVLNTWANVDSTVNTTGDAKSFYLAIRDVWLYCKKRDKITITADGVILPIVNKGTFKRVGSNGTKTIEDLKKSLNNGYTFNRAGRLQLSKKQDKKWQASVMHLYEGASKLVQDKLKITPFLIYGSLLGQVREGGFIGHDDDFDIAFISRHTSGELAAKELVDIATHLDRAGYSVELRRTAIHIHDKDNPKLRIDLFHLFFNDKGELCFPFGVAGTKHYMKKDWKGVKASRFADYDVMVPKNAKLLVEVLYGSSWKTPIAGFNWDHARTRRDTSGDTPETIRDKFNKATS